jgi:hypothetical protein
MQPPVTADWSESRWGRDLKQRQLRIHGLTQAKEGITAATVEAAAVHAEVVDNLPAQLSILVFFQCQGMRRPRKTAAAAVQGSCC